MSEHLNSDLPTNRGVLVTGAPGTGKTAIILQLVEYSCFGRALEDEENYQGRRDVVTKNEQVRPLKPSSFQSELPTTAAAAASGVESIYGQSQASLALSMAASSNPNSLRCLASQVVAYHFCQLDNAPTCLVPEFVHSVAAQMTQAPQLTPYYQLVNSDPNLQV